MVFSRLMKIIRPGERRRERRVKVRLSAEVNGIRGRVTDVSLGGFGFYPDDEGLTNGLEADGVIAMDDGTSFEVPCRVVGSDEEGMVLCVAFREVTPEQFDALEAIIMHQAVGDHPAEA